MIPYVIINGKNSRNIDGLVIQSLPPITKPKIRTSITEVDGRDGDIVTTLGYSAYNKALTIGLKGDYNVDDVIEYFDSEGEIIFSNEPDKYYNFATYETIDFYKLVRFKTANISLHVQPFKFSAEEPPILKNLHGLNFANIPIRNTGNIYSKPKIRLTGKYDVSIYINDKPILTLDLPAAGKTMIIENMNAVDEQGNYLNRLVTGDYSDLVLKTGANNVKIMGLVSEIEISKYSRWI